MRTPLIQLKQVMKSFTLESGNEVKVLDNVNFSVYDDEFVALLGPSGSGKSTCLRIMAGLTPATSGEVLSREKPIEGINLDVALVFQSFALFPWETVYTNIALALKPMRLPQGEIKVRVKKAIDLVGLEGFEEAYPRELSGGMKQRVGVARAIVMDRPVLFLDEPFSALDVLTADTLRTEMVKIFLDKKTATRSMLMVTHNINEAVFMAKRILVMGINPGHIRREIVNDLPYPRDDQSPAFRRMVQQIHAMITEAMIPDAPGAHETPSPTSSALPRPPIKEPPLESLPNVQIVEMIGLLEAIGDRGGTADIFELGQATGKEYGRILYLVKAAELLDLVDTPKQMVQLTDLGRHFFDGDINVRKRMLHELFGALRIVQMTTNLLRTDEHLRVPVEALTERVAEWLPNENPDAIVEALVSWGRFAEYFGYNDDTKEVYLDVGQETT
ncbi:MAG: nitrate/sulfonate/bicarbonate ABC transporter ATP-binding protein [Oligoflexia bacterium]|nr:nitrate/sulfonate/bicarbonate ABC transporter ATP-binding protein [Oligoflexia bacterium]